MRWIRAAGLLSEPEVNEEVAQLLAVRFELFFTLGSSFSCTELNGMNETELRAVAIAREKYEGQHAAFIKARNEEARVSAALGNALDKAASRMGTGA